MSILNIAAARDDGCGSDDHRNSRRTCKATGQVKSPPPSL